MSPAALLDRVTGGRGALALKYSMASIVGTVLTQVQLWVYVETVGWDPTWSNVLAVSMAAGPVFLLNKRWVWLRDGRVSFRTELLPFWLFTIAGLALSTGFVTLAKGTTDSTVVLMAASLGGFGVLWIAKFLFLDQVMFKENEPDPLPAVAGGGR